jgi:hypothetical protein
LLAAGASLLGLVVIVGFLGLRGGSDEPEPVHFSTGLSVLGSFAEVPLSELSGVTEPNAIGANGAVVQGVDFDEIAELTGIERTRWGDLDTEWADILIYGATDRENTPIVATQLPTFMSPALRTPEEFESEFGWEGDEIAAAVSWQGPDLGFGFDVFRLDSDMSSLTERAGTDAVVDIGSGPDLEPNFAETSTLRPSGVPVHIGVDPARAIVAVAESTTAVGSWLDREDATVADDAVANALASALDQTGDVYSFQAYFADFAVETWFDGPIPDALGFTIDDLVITETFEALGVGWSGIADTQRTSIVYVFDSADAAAASVEPITQLFAPDAPFVDTDGVAVSMDSLIEVDSVTSSGTAVTVVGRAAPGAGPKDIVPGFRRPSPFSLHR